MAHRVVPVYSCTPYRASALGVCYTVAGHGHETADDGRGHETAHDGRGHETAHDERGHETTCDGCGWAVDLVNNSRRGVSLSCGVQLQFTLVYIMVRTGT